MPFCAIDLLVEYIVNMSDKDDAYWCRNSDLIEQFGTLKGFPLMRYELPFKLLLNHNISQVIITSKISTIMRQHSIKQVHTWFISISIHQYLWSLGDLPLRFEERLAVQQWHPFRWKADRWYLADAGALRWWLCLLNACA